MFAFGINCYPCGMDSVGLDFLPCGYLTDVWSDFSFCEQTIPKCLLCLPRTYRLTGRFSPVKQWGSVCDEIAFQGRSLSFSTFQISESVVLSAGQRPAAAAPQ